MTSHVEPDYKNAPVTSNPSIYLNHYHAEKAWCGTEHLKISEQFNVRPPWTLGVCMGETETNTEFPPELETASVQNW
jgi:hypothetical protein